MMVSYDHTRKNLGVTQRKSTQRKTTQRNIIQRKTTNNNNLQSHSSIIKSQTVGSSSKGIIVDEFSNDKYETYHDILKIYLFITYYFFCYCNPTFYLE